MADRALSRADTMLIETVQAHLRNLASLASYNAGEGQVRVASGSLRSLLVEQSLARAWKLAGMGGPITCQAWCIVETIGDDAVAYCGGGDILPGIPVSFNHNARVALRQLDLGDFCRRPRIQVGRTKASTVDVVKFVANALGGIHFDQKDRKSEFEMLRRLEAGEIGNNGILSARVNGRNLVHHEILSIAQVVVRSPEVMKLQLWRPSQPK